MQSTRDMVRSGETSQGEATVAARRVITLSIDSDQRRALVDISRSRSEATGRVERARMIIAYLDTPSAYVVARQIGVSQQTVTRCLERAAELGVLAALDDRPRAGRDAVITREARTWLVSLACAKPIASGYPHELWTTRLLAAHARNHGPQAGHPSLAKLAQGTVCKILAAHEIKPHKIRYYVEQRDPDFEPKMAEVLCVYREVEMRRAAAADRDGGGQIAILSDDEKPGIQAIGNTTPDLPPVPGTHPTTQRDDEYKRHGTVTLMAGIDLLTGTVHALVKSLPRRRPGTATAVASSSSSSKSSTLPTRPQLRSKLFWTITRRTSRGRPRRGWPLSRTAASRLCSPPNTVPGSTSSRGFSPKQPGPCSATSVSSPHTN